MALQPHFVKTKMIAEAEEQGANFGTESVEACVGATLRDLGYESTTYGTKLHEVIGATFTFLMKALPSKDPRGYRKE